MEAEDRTARNADELHRRLAARRRELMAAPNETDNSRAEAVAQFDVYVNLLQLTPPIALGNVPASRSRMMLKLEFDDGRWDVTEGELDEMPSVGDNLRLADGRMSRVRKIQTVSSGRSRKPPRKIVVCTLFA